MRGELETERDCHILTPSSSDHSSTSSSICWAVQPGSWGPKPSVWSWFSLRHLISNWNYISNSNCNCNSKWTDRLPASNWHKPSLAPVGVRICTEFNHVQRSRWYSDILDRMHQPPVTQVNLGRVRVRIMKRTVVLIVIGGHGIIPKGLLWGLDERKSRGRAEITQTKTLLWSARIVSRVLESWRDLLSLNSSKSLSAYSTVKNLQGMIQ